MKKEKITELLCANGCNKPRAPRYLVCQRCRHGLPVPCPSCNNLKRPGSKVCVNCFRNQAKGHNHNCWKGGKTKDGQGYVRIYKPDDPRANCGRYMKEHTLVMEQYLGRQLIKGETVHHKNGDRSDNRIENLELWSTNHCSGQRIEDKIKWAIELLQLYSPDKLI